MQACRLLRELARIARSGKGELAHVVLDVEVRVVDPVGLVQAERDSHQPLPEGGIR